MYEPRAPSGTDRSDGKIAWRHRWRNALRTRSDNTTFARSPFRFPTCILHGIVLDGKKEKCRANIYAWRSRNARNSTGNDQWRSNRREVAQCKGKASAPIANHVSSPKRRGVLLNKHVTPRHALRVNITRERNLLRAGTTRRCLLSARPVHDSKLSETTETPEESRSRAWQETGQHVRTSFERTLRT